MSSLFQVGDASNDVIWDTNISKPAILNSLNSDIRDLCFGHLTQEMGGSFWRRKRRSPRNRVGGQGRQSRLEVHILKYNFSSALNDPCGAN
jgi:hypothetical protein